MQSKIVITNDFDALKLDLEAKFDTSSLRFFISNEFLLENAHDVIKEAYIAESSPKLLVIMSKIYRVEAQNSLLKIIEEPPKNIYFLIATQSKNLLLQTIRSRLILENLLKSKQRKTLEINLKQLDMAEIYKFLENIEAQERSDKFGKNELKELVSDIVVKALEIGFRFSDDELSYFYKLISLVELNAKSPQILTPLLLTILRKGRV
ncbi:DNA polymerase III subunit delta' [Campylobacter mucosalis]|uniref:DNA polymerase III, delta prime subunit n=1 Tax=Campylobacter mucosalis CCUG 21559 TaxID=1032067 RepID=A0A6G5QHV7_9BACT|nr:DNA polymerase III subunit delta' [Campylobacter mucosalis]QCD45189.1 DNA polymerase III, delta prime subunit [Campylobacter mucosalis CCUG 21559]